MCVYARVHLKNAKMKRQWCSAQHRNRRTRRQTSCAIRGVHSSTIIPSGRPAKRAVKVARCSGDLPKESCSQNHTCQLTQDFFLYGFECVRDHNNINTPWAICLKSFICLWESNKGRGGIEWLVAILYSHQVVRLQDLGFWSVQCARYEFHFTSERQVYFF